jgi:hypothetical protein
MDRAPLRLSGPGATGRGLSATEGPSAAIMARGWPRPASPGPLAHTERAWAAAAWASRSSDPRRAAAPSVLTLIAPKKGRGARPRIPSSFV